MAQQISCISFADIDTSTNLFVFLKFAFRDLKI